MESFLLHVATPNGQAPLTVGKFGVNFRFLKSMFMYLSYREKIAVIESRDRASAMIFREILDDVLKSELRIVAKNVRRYRHKVCNILHSKFTLTFHRNFQLIYSSVSRFLTHFSLFFFSLFSVRLSGN